MTRSAFFYGTLMSHAIIGDVLCGKQAPVALKTQKLASLDLQPATLRRAKRYAVKHATYPGVVATEDEEDQVQGILCCGLTSSDILALDDYEGDEYDRRPVEVWASHKAVPCQAYFWIAGPEQLHAHDWDYEDWVATHLPTYQV
ncbi:hypothetical protein DM01DRAFT_1297404 [Hesseltinella vesiculosa]|uniref:Putative gamma-glutamylcyclotransferase n=1 Tax=Hesseltinella vesiculosa TaxID=101127 RepID=A0A1X2GX67_9FUNG|nr:hypothetical protein DM01DRAFT_1297404 [Hesseltinella vesiculosa]